MVVVIGSLFFTVVFFLGLVGVIAFDGDVHGVNVVAALVSVVRCLVVI